MSNKYFFMLIPLCLFSIFPQSLVSLPLKYTKGFDRLLVQERATADFLNPLFLNPLIGGVIFQKNQDLIENLVDYGQTKQTLARIDAEKGTHEIVNVPSHPFPLLAQHMFHRPTQNVRFIPTRVDPFFKSTVSSIEKQAYVLGWLCALVTEGEAIWLQTKNYLALSKKIYDTPERRTLQRLLRERAKLAPDIVRFTEQCRDLLKITDIFLPAEIVQLALSACIMGSRKIGINQTEKVEITVYQKNLPLILISSYVYAQAQSKHDLTEFVRGFFDHCSNRDLIFTPEGIKVLSSATEQAAFEKTFYTKEDVKRISEFQNPQQPSYYNAVTQFAGAILHINRHSHTPAETNEVPEKPTVSDLLFIGAQATEQTDNCNIKTRSGYTCDCAECGILFLAKNILFNEDTEQYDPSLLPEEIQNNPFVKEFPEKFQGNINDLIARTWWFYLFSDKEGQLNKADFVYANSKHFYELEPEVDNVRKALALFFGVKATTFAELEKKLSSARQTVHFDIEENKSGNNKVKITMSTTTTHNQSTKKSIIVVEWHQHIAIKEESCFNKWAFNGLIKSTINKTLRDFPFNILFFDLDLDINSLFLHSFAGNGFNTLCKMGISETGKDKAARQKTQRELFNLESINFTHKHPDALTSTVIDYFLDHLNERPYKNLIESLNPAELLRFFHDDKSAFAFLQKVNQEWVKTNALELAPRLFGPQNTNYDFMPAFAYNPTTAPYCYFIEQLEPEFILLGLCNTSWQDHDGINNFLKIMGSDWFTKQVPAMWRRVKNSSDVLSIIARNLSIPLMSSLVDTIGVDSFLKQIVDVDTDNSKYYISLCDRNWCLLHIKNIWDAFKKNKDTLMHFMNLLSYYDLTPEQQNALLTQIPLKEFVITLHKADLLEKMIKGIQEFKHDKYEQFLMLIVNECKKLRICTQNLR